MFVAQVRLMLPQVAEPLDDRVYEDLHRRLMTDEPTASLGRALEALARGRPAESSLANLIGRGRPNGLVPHLRLLVRLRELERTGAEPVEVASAVRSQLRRCLVAPNIRLHAADERSLAFDVFREHDVSPRRAVVEADNSPYRLGGIRLYAPDVLDELGERLTTLAVAWKGAGRNQEAQLAAMVCVRLLTDAVQESPLPELALTASERLPPALRLLDAEAAARQASALRDRWREACNEVGPGLLPHNRGFALAAREQQRLLDAMAASTLAAGTWCVLALLCGVLVMAMMSAGTTDEIVQVWAWQGRGAWVAPLIVCLPLLAGVLILVVAHVPYEWLISWPTIPAAVTFPLFGLLTWPLACRISVRSPGEEDGAAVPQKAIWGMCFLFVLVVIVTALVPIKDEPWRPPIGIQQLRMVVPAGAGLSAMLAIVWGVWSWIRHRGAGRPVRPRLRAGLAVASSALLVTSAVWLALLITVRIQADCHADVLVIAAGEPIAHRLGPDWYHQYLEAARAATASIDPIFLLP